MTTLEPLLTTQQVAEWLQVNPRTLHRWAKYCHAEFPPPDFSSTGRRSCRWKQSTITRWLERRSYRLAKN